jgi:hypothetical protein
MRRRRMQLLLLAMAMIAVAPSGCFLEEASRSSESFVLRLKSAHSYKSLVHSRRRLLRNSTFPLHGAVKDYGCANTSSCSC